MSIKKIWGTRSKSANAATYVGERGTIFYNEADGELRLSDGVTSGGVAIAVRADLIVAQRLTPGADNNIAYGLGDETHRWYDLHIGDGGIYFNGHATAQTVPYTPGDLDYSLIPTPTDASLNLGSDTHRWGDLYLGGTSLHLLDQTTGDDVSVSVVDGILYFNGASGLAVGPLFFEDNVLKTETIATDILVGETDDTGIFNIRRKAQFNNTTFGSTEAMVSFNASGGADPATIFPDTVMQTVGRPNKNSRIVQRSYGSSSSTGGANAYGVWASYAARGNTASPAALKENDILARISANGYGTTTWGSGGARVEFVALEDFTDTAKGTRINFWTTPEGQITSQNVASINSVGVVAAGIQFTTDDTLQTTAGIPLSQKAIANAPYVATLGDDGKLDSSQIPTALTGAVVFKGVWNANTNTPTLSNSLPTGLETGWEYVVSDSGTRDIGDGSQIYTQGDFVIYDGTHWKVVRGANAFVSLTSGGHITASSTTGAITLGSDATPNSTNSTIVSRDASGNFSANVITASLSGTVTGNVTGNVSGNAGTVTNGVYTNGSYSDPSWLTLSKSKVGLSNVDNTADASKNVLYATTAGGAPATDVYAWAKAATKPTYTKSDVGLSAVENTALSTWAGSSNITTVGTLGSLSVTATITGSVSGNAGTVTNGVYTNGSYANPSWITSLAASKVGLGSVENTALSTWAGSSNITTVGTLTNLAIATNGTITTPRIVINDGGLRTVSGGTTLTINFATDSIILWTAPTGTAVITLSNYTAGAQVKLIIAVTTARDITYGIASAALSSTGLDNWNGVGGGSIDITNTAVHLEYTCITALAAGCYVKVTAN